MNKIDSRLLFKIIECHKALFLHSEELDFVDYDKSVECIDPTIEKNAILWLKNGKNIHPYSYQNISKWDITVKIDLVSQQSDGFALEKLLFVGTIRRRDKEDLLLQVYLLAQFGVRVSRVIVYLPSKDAVFGQSFYEIFEVVELSDLIRANLFHLKRVDLLLQEPLDPFATIGRQCFFPYKCGFYYKCFEDFPKNSILNLARMRKERRFELYEQGVTTTDLIPKNLSFTNYQEIQIRAEKSKKAVVDWSSLEQFFEQVSHPIYFLDFETVQHSIAPFADLIPYEPLPFQYSLHILYDDDRLEHYDFLADGGSDARCEIAYKLAKEIGDHGTIFAYGAEYERRILRRLADWCPKYGDILIDFASRVVDLMKPFEKRWFYHPDMMGSFSLKSVAPIFDDTINYKELDIGAGFDALKQYMKLAQCDLKTQEKIKEDLLQYGFYDTYSLVQIYRALKSRLIK